MDLAKDWSLNAYYITNYLPYLLPEQGIIVHQDYIHYNEYWLQITMQHFADNFELCGVLYGNTAFFRLIKPLTKADCEVDLQALPFSAKWELLEEARRRVPPAAQEVLKARSRKMCHRAWRICPGLRNPCIDQDREDIQ